MKRPALFSFIVFVCFSLCLFFSTGCSQEEGPEKPARQTPKPDKTADRQPKDKEGPSDADKTPPGEDGPLQFAFIPKGEHIPVFSYAKTGAERQAQKYGNVVIIWEGPSRNDQVKQKEILESFISQNVDGIAISCLNGEYLAPAINKAVEKGIPVVTFDSDAPGSKRAAFYGVNDFEAGVIMGKELQKLLGEDGGKIAVLTTRGADNLTKRLEGALSVIHQHPEIEVVETFNVQDESITAARAIKTATETYPDLKAWLSVGGWPGYSKSILEPVPDGTKVICFDTIPPAPKLIKKGKINMALGQKYFGWGSVPTRILYNIVVKDEYPDEKIVDSGVDIVTPDNVDEYIKKWEKMKKGEIVE